MELKEMQKYALKCACEGHNLLITGQCGTGKTYVMRCIIKQLQSKDKKIEVAVTSTTGMASTQLGLGATTIHHWSGLGDARYTKEELQETFMSDDRYINARDRIKNATVLVIDEIGMLSEVIFNKLEYVCRLVRDNQNVFGGLQVIASGDFKQLPPVPNYMYQDPGTYCFQSEMFKLAFPHHCNLYEVVRQTETDLIRAVNQLCDGCPDEHTEALLKSLERNLEDEENVCRLFGTKFDASYVNQLHLDELDGNSVVYKARDEGQINLLTRSDGEKFLELKVNAPVILIRNLPGALFNGLRGVVQELSQEKGPTVNFDGRIVTLEQVKFEIYNPSTKKTLATRTQYPLKLSYALTVHRAQGQTLEKVEIDCYSFFAAGQMGVAVGRAVNKSGLRILNYNSRAANLRHPQVVYDFYGAESEEPKEDISCCKKLVQGPIQSFPTEYSIPRSHGSSENIPSSSKQIDPSTSIKDKCPWSLDEFLNESTGTTFLPDEITDQFKVRLSHHADFLNSQLASKLKRKLSSSEDFSALYRDVNDYLISEDHVSACSIISDSPKPQKLSSKLFFFLLNKEIQKRSENIVEKQKQKFGEHAEEHAEAAAPISDAAKSKIRYIAGACIYKIICRLRHNVLKKIGHTKQQTKTERDWSYRSYKLLSALRVSEDDAKKMTSVPESMSEIDFRQGPSRGLLHVSDEVFQFFLQLNISLQELLSPKSFHIYGSDIHVICRKYLFGNAELLKTWIDLFQTEGKPEIDADIESDVDELLCCMLTELYELVTEHFLRISLVEGLHHFKTEIPRKKKQALRSKVKALSEREQSASKKVKLSYAESEESDIFICNICNSEISETPEKLDENSIACDSCNNWFHFKCVKLSGKESLFKKQSSTWKCPGCSSKGKGRGKKSSS